MSEGLRTGDEIIIVPWNNEVCQISNLVHTRDALLRVGGVVKVFSVTEKIAGRNGVASSDDGESVAIESQTVMGWRVTGRG